MFEVTKEMKDFVNENFYYDGIITVGYNINENGKWEYRNEEQWVVGDDISDDMIDILEENKVIYRFDDDKYHIENDYIEVFFGNDEERKKLIEYQEEVNRAYVKVMKYAKYNVGKYQEIMKNYNDCIEAAKALELM